jgi:hypothetical protein
MSNFLAIATVTAAFRRLILQAVQADVTGAGVSMVRPSEPGAATGIPGVGVNVFLYEVAPVPPLRNDHLPARRNNGGALVQRPVAALELHYLLSFYGNESNLEPQRLLGSTVAKLMAEPLLTRNRLNAAITDAQMSFLATSNLPDQVDAVKFTPLSLSIEEMSRLWSIFFQTRYALSMAWRASAVLIEPQIRPAPALPVRDARLVAVPLRQPHIARVVAETAEDDLIVSGTNVVLQGERLRADDVQLLVGGNTVPPAEASDARIVLTLPPGLQAGPQSVQVLHRVPLGDPLVPHSGFTSNPGEFVLHPEIARVGPNYQIAIANITGSGTAPRSADVTITSTIVVGRRQQVTLELLTPATAAAPARVLRTIYAQDRAADGTALAFRVVDVPAGTYLARIRVNGAESLMEQDTTPGSPIFGQPIAPTMTLP